MPLPLDEPVWPTHVPLVLSELNEKQRRWVVGLLSEVLGYGGASQIAKLSGLDPKTIRQGCIDLSQQLANYPKERIRRAGAGRLTAKKRTLNSNNN